MNPEAIKTEADKITAQYAVYANGVVDGNLHKFSSTHCAIIHVQGQMEAARHALDYPALNYLNYELILTELKSRV